MTTDSLFLDLGKDITAIDDLTVASARDGPAYTRIRVLQYTTMLQLYSEIMEDYNASLLRYHDKCLLLLQQQRLLCTYSFETIRSQEDMPYIYLRY